MEEAQSRVTQGRLGAENSGAENFSRMPSGGQRQKKGHRGREVGALSSQTSTAPDPCCLEHKARSYTRWQLYLSMGNQWPQKKDGIRDFTGVNIYILDRTLLYVCFLCVCVCCLDWDHGCKKWTPSSWESLNLGFTGGFIVVCLFVLFPSGTWS